MPRKKKLRSPEYSLRVIHQFDERLRRVMQVFIVQTLKEFTSFEYEILLGLARQERIIELKILGLRTTDLIMPGVGPARGTVELTGLQGPYDVRVLKLDGELNEFHLEVKPGGIALTGLSPHPFVVSAVTPVESHRS